MTQMEFFQYRSHRWLMRTLFRPCTNSSLTLLLTNIKGDFMPPGLPSAGARLHQAKRRRATRNDRQGNRKERWRWCGHRKWRKGKKRKRVLSLPRGGWSGVRLMCQLDHCLFPPHVVLSFFVLLFTHTLTHRHTGPHTPECYCYWLPKLPLNFHLALQLVSVVAPLVHSPKPLEALLTGRSMSHHPRAGKRATDCRGCGSHFFSSLCCFLHFYLSGWL